MRYKLIIQEMKESTNHTVLAFVREVESMKRLTAEQRLYCMKNRKQPDAVRKLVADFIPYIIRVAYGYSKTGGTLSILDLVNEGIVGAYDAFDKCDDKGEDMIKAVRRYICKYIRNMSQQRDVLTDAEFVIEEFSSDDEEWMREKAIIDDLDRSRENLLLANMLESHLGYRARIILDYYGGKSISDVAEMYDYSRERVRQIIKDFSRLYKMSSLWKKFSKDFNLPIHEKGYYQTKYKQF